MTTSCGIEMIFDNYFEFTVHTYSQVHNLILLGLTVLYHINRWFIIF